MTNQPFVPESITVHLGAPTENAENVTVSFQEYVKNVASSEIYPTWPENSLRANIYVIVTFALNRIFTEWYRAKGFDFDITASTSYDQKFIKGREIFSNVSLLSDQLFTLVCESYLNSFITVVLGALDLCDHAGAGLEDRDGSKCSVF